MANSRHIWEGWTVQDFIDDLEVMFDLKVKLGHQTFKSKEEVKKWCKSNQPYYKKHIPEVYAHFRKKANL